MIQHQFDSIASFPLHALVIYETFVLLFSALHSCKYCVLGQPLKWVHLLTWYHLFHSMFVGGPILLFVIKQVNMSRLVRWALT